MTPLNEQIKAIQEVKNNYKYTPELHEALNDAGTTLSALNLTKDLPDREKYWENLDFNFDHYFTAVSEDRENDFKEYILRITFDAIKEREARIGELEEALSEVIENENQNSFFMEGYRNGSASISEVMAAGDNLNNSLSKAFKLLNNK